MASLRNYFVEEKHKREAALAEKPQSIEDDADFERITKINDEWNRNVAKIRIARLEQQRIQMREKIQWELEQQRQYEDEERQRLNELVLKEKVCASNTIQNSLGIDEFYNHVCIYPYLGSSKIVHCT